MRVRFRQYAMRLAVLLALAVVFVPSVVFAQAPAELPADFGLDQVAEETGLGTEDIRVVIARIIRTVLGLLGIVAVVIVIAGGFVWMTAGGDDKKVLLAKKILTNGAIGLAITVSAYSITHFVLKNLTEAVMGPGEGGAGEDAGPGGFGGRGCANPPCGGNNFVAKISPNGQQRIQNVLVKTVFSERGRDAAYDPASLQLGTNIKVYKTEDRERAQVAVELVQASATELHLKPIGPCPAPNEAIRECFDANTSYTVELTTSIKSAGGRTLYCPLAGDAFNCKRTFVTGDQFDNDAPTVAIVNYQSGESVPIGGNVEIRARARDGFGVDTVQFELQDQVVHTSDVEDVTDVTATFAWDVDADVYKPREAVQVRAIARDVDGHVTASEAVRLIPRPEHCFNRRQDADEAGPDCGGQFCGACAGAACRGNADCAAGVCRVPAGAEVGVCVELPLITGVTPGDGAPGTVVTIEGRYFGAQAGQVVFYKSANEAVPAGQACGAQWSSNTVVVSVPAGLEANKIAAIGVRTKVGDEDRTNDDRGAKFENVFTVNAVTRPGLCTIDPAFGLPNDRVTVRGVNLGDGGASALLFEDQPVRVDKWSRDRDGELGEVVGFVPNFGAGMARVLAQVGDQKSNPLLYEVRAFREQDRPQIGSISPDRGPVGTYVTIAGTGFGAAGQGSVAVFEHKASGVTFFADMDFPAECGAGTWNDRLIVAKVPRGVDLGAAAGGVAAYKIYVKRGAAQVQSNAVDFGIAVAGQPSPGICKIDPNMRPTGGTVDIYGENFGRAPGNVIFWDANATPDVATWTSADVRAVGAVWEETGRHVSIAVPEGAVSGPVKVVRQENQAQSNGYDFIVGSCVQNRNQCPVAGQTCCQSGFYTGSCQESCAAGARTAEYSWIFSTGNIPLVPDVVQCCGRNCPLANPLPSPAPWSQHQNSQSVCTGALVRGTFTTNVDPNRGNPEDNFVLEKCSAEGDNPCSEFTAVHTGAVVRNGAKQAEFSFSGEHRPNLEPDTTYQVRIVEGLMAMPDAEAGREGGEMRADPAMVEACGGERHARGTAYCFRFRTNDRECAIGAVEVAPKAFTAKELGFLVATDDNNVIPELTEDAEPLYRSGVTAAGNSCVALDPSQFAWQWNESSRGEVAQVLAAGREGTFTRFIQALKPSDTPVTISATASGVTGSGTLLVSPGDPQIIAAWPQCQEACVNVDAGISFNIPMDAVSLSPMNIGVHRCRNELCKIEDINEDVASGRAPNMLESITYEDVNDPEVPPYAKHRARLNFTGDLAVGAFYRVILTPGVRSKDGVSITKISDEYDTSVDFNNQNQMWKSFVFRVRNDDKPCAIQSVDVQPVEGTVRAIGSQKWFRAAAQGEANGCGPNGRAELLNAAAMSWAWTASDPAVVGLQSFDVSARPAAGCTAQCLLIGSAVQSRLCGNGRLDTGEDCDPANGTWCTDRCLFAGTSAPTCGNNNVDEGEQCDDGNAAAGDGCSDKCLAEGASTTKVTCGNTDIAPGENCDDGNKTAGDGCSSECIKEGTRVSEAWCRAQGDGALDRYPACVQAVASCGNGVLENGEACDPPQAGACSDRCLSVGGAGKDTCGNGVLEPQLGEECDDGNAAIGDGCEQCLLRGSSPKYANSSLCGDGRVGTGESFRCESNQHGDGRPDPLVLATLQSIAGHEQELQGDGADEARIETEIRAQASYGDTTGSGNAKLVLQCGFTQADQCPDPERYGVGSNGCCYAYPIVSDPQPVGDGACRNPALSFVINSGVSQRSLEGNIIIAVERQGACQQGEVEIAIGDQDIRFVQTSWLERIAARIRHAVRQWFGAPVNAAPQPGQPNGARCLANAQCASGSCVAGRCVAAGAQPAAPAQPAPKAGQPEAQPAPKAEQPAAQPAAQPEAPAAPAPKAGQAQPQAQPAPKQPGAAPMVDPVPAKAQPAAEQPAAALPGLKQPVAGDLPPAPLSAKEEEDGNVKMSLEQQEELARAIKEQRKQQEKAQAAAREAAGAPAPAAPAEPAQPAAPPVWCASTLQARYRVIANEDKTTTVQITPLSLLEPNSRYRIIVRGGAQGVRDGRNVPLKQNVEWQFNTGPHVCTLDEVRVEPNAWVFSTTQQGMGSLCAVDADCGEGGLCVDAAGDGNEKRCDLSRHRFIARAYTGNGENVREIAPVSNYYDWRYEWGPTQDSIVEVTADQQQSTALVATKQGKSGTETVAAKATMTADQVNNPSQAQAGRERVVTGAATVMVSACEHPWPSLAGGSPVFPYEDVSGNDDGIGRNVPAGTQNIWTNFSTWYCRDAGDKGEDGDLPALTPQFIQYHRPNTSLLKRFHLLTPDGEAVGIMVRTNPEWLSLADWYENEFPGQGKPRPIATADGFEAAQLADTVYINAVNYDPANGSLFANVYVISLSGVGRAKPSATIRSIFDQIVKNLQLTTNIDQYNRCAVANNQDPDMASPKCSADVECIGDFAGRQCLADRDKLRRDLTRVLDARTTLKKLQEYKVNNAAFPRLNEVENQVGSFVPFFTTSKWGSWQSALGNSLATRVPEDPVNKFVACSADQGYDPETCWNSATQTFQCNGGNAYQYRTNAAGDAAEVWMNFEFFDPARQRELGTRIDEAGGNGAAFREGACVAGELPVGRVEAAAVGAAACGNGIREGAEVCDDGSSNGRYGGYCNAQCNGTTGYCGDRVLQAEELCDPTTRAGVRPGVTYAENRDGSCGWDCQSYGLYCGDNVVTATLGGRETCDDGNKNNGDGCNSQCVVEPQPPAVCGNGRKEGAEQCDGGERCDAQCRVIGAYCGNSLIDAGEVCDNGAQNGAVCTGEYGRQCSYCSADCRTVRFASGPYCGDGRLDRPHEICDGAVVPVNHVCINNRRFTVEQVGRCDNSCVSFICDADRDNLADREYVSCTRGDTCRDAEIRLRRNAGNTLNVYRVQFGKADGDYTASIESDVRSAIVLNYTLPRGTYKMRVTWLRAPERENVTIASYTGFTLTLPDGVTIQSTKTFTSGWRGWVNNDEATNIYFVESHAFSTWRERYDRGETRRLFGDWMFAVNCDEDPTHVSLCGGRAEYQISQELWDFLRNQAQTWSNNNNQTRYSSGNRQGKIFRDEAHSLDGAGYIEFTLAVQ